MNRAEQLRRASKQANLPSFAVVVYDALVSKTDWATGWLPDMRQPRSVTELAGWAGVSRTLTVRALAVLVEYGWIERKPPAILRRGLATTYQVRTGRRAPARPGEPMTEAERARRYRARKRDAKQQDASRRSVPKRHADVSRKSEHMDVTKPQVNGQSAHWAVVGGSSGEASLKTEPDSQPRSGYNKHDDPDATWAEPAPGRYCLARCYCGNCPHYVPMAERPTNTPDTYTAVDRKAILSSTGRRTNTADYRQAQREAAGDDT